MAAPAHAGCPARQDVLAQAFNWHAPHVPTQPPCAPPSAAVSYSYGGAPPTYRSKYDFVVDNAWQGASTFYCEGV